MIGTVPIVRLQLPGLDFDSSQHPCLGGFNARRRLGYSTVSEGGRAEVFVSIKTRNWKKFCAMPAYFNQSLNNQERYPPCMLGTLQGFHFCRKPFTRLSKSAVGLDPVAHEAMC